eukprot:6812982-Karenia_brevis.AAC.1
MLGRELSHLVVNCPIGSQIVPHAREAGQFHLGDGRKIGPAGRTNKEGDPTHTLDSEVSVDNCKNAPQSNL